MYQIKDGPPPYGKDDLYWVYYQYHNFKAWEIAKEDRDGNLATTDNSFLLRSKCVKYCVIPQPEEVDENL